MLVKDGQRVKKGETLITLEKTSSEAELTSAKELLTINQQILRKFEPLA
ncbi:biotin/lipoyl-binding protein [Nostoc sp. PCC 9305]